MSSNPSMNCPMNGTSNLRFGHQKPRAQATTSQLSIATSPLQSPWDESEDAPRFFGFAQRSNGLNILGESMGKPEISEI